MFPLVLGTWVKSIGLTEADLKRCPLWDLVANGMYTDMQAVFFGSVLHDFC